MSCKFIWTLCLIALPSQAAQFSLRVGEISSPELQASNVTVRYFSAPAGALDIHIDRLVLHRHTWRNASLICSKVAISDKGVIDCPQGILAAASDSMPISFFLDPAHKKMRVSLQSANNELWQAQASMQGKSWQAALEVANGRANRLPADIELPVAFSEGLLNGHFDLNGNNDGLQNAEGNLDVANLKFADADGTHAGERVAARTNFNLRRDGARWHWRLDSNWTAGEVFWQPLYLASGDHQLQASGQLDGQSLKVENANLSLKNIGQIAFNGQMNLANKEIQQLDLSAPNLELAQLYPLLLKPYLEKTVLNNLEMAGQASLKLDLQQGEPKSFQLDLKNVDITDKNGRFELYKVNANLPWDYDEAKAIKLAYESGQLLHLPLGTANITAELNRYALTAPEIKLPVLDGALNLSDVSAAWVNQEWHWHLRANISPIAMPEFSQALGWPRMEGKVSAAIPLVTYTGGQLNTDGAMSFNVFDGTAVITNLDMQNPLGIAPKLTGSMQFRNLDLGDLTRTFSFGAIEGKLDGDVNNLQLANWQPVNFDADFHSSPGKYPKKISQRAVENISSLGGAGAAAAIQRSVLRFFKEFNYEKIGLSCKLRNDKCEMSGVESTPQGYIIVKGSGVPSITVMGYNHDVSWGELLARIKRITEGNAKPIIK